MVPWATPIARPKAMHLVAHGLDDSGQGPHPGIDAGRPHPHQDVLVADHRDVDVLET